MIDKLSFGTRKQWRSQTFPDGGAQSFYRILSMITHRHAGSYVHLLKVVVCMEKAYSTSY